MRNLLVKIVVENKTRLMSGNSFPENLAVCERMWKNIVETGRAQMTIWRMRTACWIPKDTDTHSEYVLSTYCCLLTRLSVKFLRTLVVL